MNRKIWQWITTLLWLVLITIPFVMGLLLGLLLRFVTIWHTALEEGYMYGAGRQSE
jgi:hypothetical protein